MEYQGELMPDDYLDLDVMSFNIKYGTAPDGLNHWLRRRRMVFDLMKSYRPDVMCLQEALRSQIGQIRRALPEYAMVGVGRDDGRKQGEHVPILYLAARFVVSEENTFWLSDTPTVAGSTSWDHRIPRICTYVRLVHEPTGTAFYVFNTHLDHTSQRARELGAELISGTIGERMHGDPVILTGDMNAESDNTALAYLRGESGLSVASELPEVAPSPELRDTFSIAHPGEPEDGTLHSFEGGTHGPRIDYIMASDEIEVLSAEICRDNRNGRYPSDHYPVMARLRIPARVEDCG